MSTKHLLDHIEIVSPCSADWDSMTGNDQIRFCQHCSLMVNDLTGMTHKQIKQLITRSNGRFCVRYFPAPQRTESIPKKLHQISRRVSRLAAGAFTATLSLSSVVAQTQQLSRSSSPHAETLPAAAAVTANTGRPFTAAVVGSLRDPNGALIPGGSITLANSATRLSLQTTSDAQGEYRFDLLEPGTYELKAEAPGFATAVVTNVVLEAGAVSRADRNLEVAGVNAEVQIVAQSMEFQGLVSVGPAEPLVRAAQENDLEAVRNALFTANVNVRDANTDTTALEAAVRRGNRDMVQMLLAAGADVNSRDRSRQTVLMLLAEETPPEVVWDLISAGAKVNLKDKEGDTALIQTAGRDNAGVVKALLDAGAKVDAKNNEGKSALIISAAAGYLNNLKTLILAGANINSRDHDGKTALTYARENEQTEVVKFLEAYGAQE